MTKLVEKNDKVKSFSALLVENQLIPVPIRFLNQLRKAQVLQNSLRKVYLSILLSNWNCYLWETITAYNYGFAQDLPEKGKPCAKPLTVAHNIFSELPQNASLLFFRKKINEICKWKILRDNGKLKPNFVENLQRQFSDFSNIKTILSRKTLCNI